MDRDPRDRSGSAGWIGIRGMDRDPRDGSPPPQPNLPLAGSGRRRRWRHQSLANLADPVRIAPRLPSPADRGEPLIAPLIALLLAPLIALLIAPLIAPLLALLIALLIAC